MLLSRFSDVFYVDASTRQTIRADLSQIALAKGLGSSEKAALDWLSGQRKEWLLLLDNADDPTSQKHEGGICQIHEKILHNDSYPLHVICC